MQTDKPKEVQKGEAALENLSAYICVNLRLDLFFFSSGPFGSIRG
jgi:hypothetical protein